MTLFALYALCGCSPMQNTGLGEAGSPAPVSQAAQNEPGDRDAGGASQTAKQPDAAETAARLAPCFSKGFALSAAHQDVLRHPSAARILYLMRAARFAEAAQYAPNAQNGANASAALRYVGLKARLLSRQCTAQSPCSDAFDSALSEAIAAETGLSAETAERFVGYRRIESLIAENRLARAVDLLLALARSPDCDRSELRRLTLAFAGKIVADGLPAGGAQSALQLPETKKAAELLSVAEPGGNAFESASITYAAMKIAERIGDARAAEQMRDRLILRYPATQMSMWPELVSSPEALADRFSPQSRYARIGRLISRFDYDSARRELKALIASPGTPKSIAAQAEWDFARVSMTNSEDPATSERIYRKYAQGKGDKAEEAAFGIARALSRQLRYRDAIEALKAYDRRFPRGKHAKRSLYLRGWYAFDLRENDEARPLLKAYAESANDTSVWGFYAQTFLRDGAWQDAVAAFDKLHRAGNPIVRGKALYWQAYAHHAMGNDEAARASLASLHAQYPLTWYDMLALMREAQWFGADRGAAVDALFRAQTDAPPVRHFYPYGYGIAPKELPARSKIYRAIMGLIAIDEVSAARALYLKHEAALLSAVSVSARDGLRLHMTHLTETYYRAWEDVSGSVRALSGVMPERSNPRSRMAYPQPFAPLAESLARRYGIPKYFIYGIMLQESRFRPNQVSSADAIGALQMIPKTARVIAKDLGLEYHPETFFDPKVGFEYSVYYMHLHSRMWGGNLAFTAGSYNGGPHRIGPWALRDKGKTLDIIVDEFSFDESRHYTRKVAEHALRFAYLYAPSIEVWRETVDALFPVAVPEIEPRSDWGI